MRTIKEKAPQRSSEQEKPVRIPISGRKPAAEPEDTTHAKTERHKKSLSNTNNFKQITMVKSKNLSNNIPIGIYTRLENIWRQTGKKLA
jgi:hypothetical protein